MQIHLGNNAGYAPLRQAANGNYVAEATDLCACCCETCFDILARIATVCGCDRVQNLNNMTIAAPPSQVMQMTACAAATALSLVQQQQEGLPQ